MSPQRRYGILGPALLLLAAALSPGLAGKEKEKEKEEASLVSHLDHLRELEEATRAVVEKSKPAFVFIGGGSGFCISDDGYVLTNEHVVKEFVDRRLKEITVYLQGGRKYRAAIVGLDPQGDVALLKLKDAGRTPFIELGDSSKLKPGQRVVALGDPFLLGSENIFLRRVPPDYEPSASMGIVSALHRYSDTYSDAIQVDLAVNRGNSGGPLLTLDGKAVGINGKIETRFALGINTGVGYAIPANQIRRFLEPLKNAGGGRVTHGTIRGLAVAERADDKAGLPVTRVVPSSAAEKAGFRAGDLLLAVGGLPVRTRSRYLGIVATYPAGEEISVRVARGDQVVELTALLVAPGRPRLGVTTEVVRGEVNGVRVTTVRPRTAAARAGLKIGDIITQFGGSAVRNTADLKRLIDERSAGDPVTLSIVRDGRTLEVSLRLGSRQD